MQTRLLTGTKEEMARQLADLKGEVRQVIVLIEEPPQREVDADTFADMDAWTACVRDADDSREAMHRRVPPLNVSS